MSMRIIVIHGSYGSPEGNWFPWLKRELESIGHQVLLPRFPTPEDQSLPIWKAVLAGEVKKIDSSCILIGHSIGAGFVLNILEDLAGEPVRASCLIAGFLGDLGLPDFDAINSSFVNRDFDWTRIRANAGDVLVMSGDNDPYVPLDRGMELAGRLSVPLDIVPGGGHLNAESGFTSFPLLVDKLRPFLGGDQ
ncbi:MAG: serine hydrolase family protein [Cyanobacteria bacterium HKST-UBA02]|nr:serine hydrolase family protein [Cyanobacteria bacterium HKST-UBA02]